MLPNKKKRKLNARDGTFGSSFGEIAYISGHQIVNDGAREMQT